MKDVKQCSINLGENYIKQIHKVIQLRLLEAFNIYIVCICTSQIIKSRLSKPSKSCNYRLSEASVFMHYMLIPKS